MATTLVAISISDLLASFIGYVLYIVFEQMTRFIRFVAKILLSNSKFSTAGQWL